MMSSPSDAPLRGGAAERLAQKQGPFVLERDGCPLHYWFAGSEGAPVLVLTHGFSMDHRLFDAQVAELAKQYRVLVWDVRGHGRSQPLGEGFSIQRAADDLQAILDREGISECALIGHSMGGYVAQEIEYRQPWRVSALAMISSTCFTFRQPVALTMGAPFTVAALMMVPEDWYHRQVGFIAGERSEVRKYGEEASRAIPRESRIAIWSGIISSYHFEPGHRVRCPLLLLDGEHDWYVAFGMIKLLIPAWKEREPSCRHFVVPRAGHNANQDNPEFTNAALAEFLSEALGGSLPREGCATAA